MIDQIILLLGDFLHHEMVVAFLLGQLSVVVAAAFGWVMFDVIWKRGCYGK